MITASQRGLVMNPPTGGAAISGWSQVSDLGTAPYSRDGLHHGQAHHDGAGSMVLPVVWQPTDTVVAVSQDLDPQLVIFLVQSSRFSQRDILSSQTDRTTVAMDMNVMHIHF